MDYWQVDLTRLFSLNKRLNYVVAALLILQVLELVAQVIAAYAIKY